MILEILEFTGGCIIGSVFTGLIRAASKKLNRCAAERFVTTTYPDGSFREVYSSRCLALADERCDGGHCTEHCRDAKNCGGGCLP